mgnify:CR=1 FL=1
MSDNNDAVLYSLKELKDMPQGEVAQAASQSGANIKRQKKKGGWASDDDAGDLLAGILDETSRSAEQEELKRSRELMSLKAAERSAKDAEAARRREEGERRLAEEQARREEADRRRRALLREIEGPSPEEIEEERLAAEAEKNRLLMEERLRESERARLEAEREAAKAAREAKAREEERLKALADGPQPTGKGAKAAGIGLAAVALLFLLFLVVVGGGIGAYFAFSPKEIPTQTYAKALLKPQTLTATSVEKGYVATAKPEADEPAGGDGGAVAAVGAKNNTKSRRGNSRAASRKAAAKKSSSDKGGKAAKGGNKFNFGVKKGKGGIVF